MFLIGEQMIQVWSPSTISLLPQECNIIGPIENKIQTLFQISQYEKCLQFPMFRPTRKKNIGGFQGCDDVLPGQIAKAKGKEWKDGNGDVEPSSHS